MKSIFAIFLFFTTSVLQLHGGGQESKSLHQNLYEAYVMNNGSAIKQVVGALQQAHEKQPEATTPLFQLAEAQCVLLTYAIGNKKESLFEEYVDQAQENLDEILDRQPQNAKAHALLAQVYGFRIANAPWKGMFLGSKSNKAIEKAITYGPDEPTAWYQSGNANLNAPAAFGGDKAQAVRDFEKALRLIEAEGELKNNWYYLDILTWLGIAYRETGQLEKAVQTLEKAHKLEPRRAWVRDELLPEVRQRQQE